MWYNRLVKAAYKRYEPPTNSEHKSESEMNEKDKIVGRVQKLSAMAARKVPLHMGVDETDKVESDE